MFMFNLLWCDFFFGKFFDNMWYFYYLIIKGGGECIIKIVKENCLYKFLEYMIFNVCV